MNYPDDMTCIERVLGGDTEAFAAVVDRYSPAVFSLIRRICGNREDAEELTQDTFVKAFQNLGKFRRDSRFSTWLYRIAYNTVVSHSRRRKGIFVIELREEGAKNHRDEAEPDGFDSGEFSREEQFLRLERALEAISPEDRALVALFYTEDRPVREIAEILSISEGNVKVKLHRTRKRLADIYENIG